MLTYLLTYLLTYVDEVDYQSLFCNAFPKSKAKIIEVRKYVSK